MADGLLIYKLKKAYRNGTEYLLFSPEEFLEKLAALVPLPRVHLTRFHGVFAPHSKLRKNILPVRENSEPVDSAKKPSFRRRLSWAQLLKRVFKIEVDACHCGGKMKVVAAILATSAIEEILGHLGLPTTAPLILPARPPPQEAFDFS